jgi:hypothetical protein
LRHFANFQEFPSFHLAGRLILGKGMPKSGWTSFIRLPHFVAMNLGVPSPSSDGVFLLKCADCKCLAVRGANGRWESFYDDTELPHAAEAIIAVPVELILPFLPDIKRARLCPVPLPAREQTQLP